MNEKPDWDKMWTKTKAEIILLSKNRTLFRIHVNLFLNVFVNRIEIKRNPFAEGKSLKPKHLLISFMETMRLYI